MKKIKYKIKVNTGSKSYVKVILISVLFIVIGCILICSEAEETLLNTFGIILSIIGVFYLLITCFKILHLKTTTYESHDEIDEQLSKMMSQIPEDQWQNTNKTINLGNTKINYQSKIYHQKKNNKKLFDEQSINNLNNVKKIIICPNCGSKNVTKIKNSRCQYCDAYIE